MLILAIDTSTRLCSVALLEGTELLGRVQEAERRQGELLLPMVDGLLCEYGVARRDVDGIAFGRGPGAFTGVRICVAVTQGLALGLGCPVLPVSTLAALAAQAMRRHSLPPDVQLLAAMDARMGELYWGCFQDHSGGDEPEESLATPVRVALPASGSCFGIGSGWAVHAEVLAARLGTRLTGFDATAEPLAEDIARLAERAPQSRWCEAALAQPVYLRNQVADPAAWRGA